jgi:hypothetical protein
MEAMSNSSSIPRRRRLVDDRTHTELLELQKILCSDIQFFKTQQWQVTYYCFLLYGGLVGTSRLIGPAMTPCERGALVIIGAAVLSAGIYVLREFEEALRLRGELLPAARKLFTQRALAAYGKGGDPNHALRPAEAKVSLLGVFVASHALAFVVFLWLVCRGALDA